MAENARKHMKTLHLDGFQGSEHQELASKLPGLHVVLSSATHFTKMAPPLGPAQGPFWAAEAFTHCYASQLGPQLLVAWWPLVREADC